MGEWLLSPLRWLVGYGLFIVRGETPWRFFSRAAKLGYVLWGMAPAEDGVRGAAQHRALPELKKLAVECGCTLCIEEEHGLHWLLQWLWRRKGLLVGLVLALLLYGQLNGRVWNVTVHGCERYAPEEILAIAEECGVYPGARRKDFDARAVGDAMMLRLPGVGWISLNTRACFVEIELREAVPKPELEESVGLSVICAGREGQIISCEAGTGKLLVAPGEVVEAGQLLVTGVQETADGGAVFVNARAKIMARTQRSFAVELPVTVAEECSTGETQLRRSLQVFTLGLPLGWQVKPAAQGWITYTETPLRILGVEVPVALREERWAGTTTVFCTRTEAELSAAAEEALLALAAEALGPGGVVEEWAVQLSIQGESCTARMVCTCIEDIALEIPVG